MNEPDKQEFDNDPLLPPPAFDDEVDENGESEHGPIADDTSIMMGDTQTHFSSGSLRPMIGELPTVPGYRIEKKLGQGGMGAVYLAVDEKLHRYVALKLMTGRPSPEILNRFQMEIKSVASLTHPNVAQIFSADLLNEKPYYSMEYVEGSTLEEKIESDPQSPQVAAKLLLKLAKAIDFCHSKDILHRDLKPSNILMGQNGEPKIADFGLAKSIEGDNSSTKTGEILGTPGYMAPEQAGGVVKQIGPACDVYGLGAIFYRLLTGRAPFGAPEPIQTIMMVLSDDPVAPRKLQSGIPRDLETICLKCLEKRPEKRYSTAGELAHDLQSFLEGRPIQARPISTPEKCLKWSRRNPAKALMVAGLAILIPAIVGGLWWNNWNTKKLLERTRLLNDESQRLLRKSEKLADEGSNLSAWILQEHLDKLQNRAGTTAIQHDLVGRVQEYLDAATPELPDDEKFLRRHGLAYEVIADVQGNPSQPNLGQKDKALANYALGLKLFDRAIAADPNATKARLLKVRLLTKLATLEYEMKGAEPSRKTLALAESLIGQMDHADRKEVIVVEMGLFEAFVEQWIREGKFDKALEVLDQLDRDNAELKKILGDHPQPRQNSIVHLKYRTECLDKKGDYPNAAKAISQAVEIARKALPNDPDNPYAQDHLASSLIASGDVQCKLRDFEKAMDEYEEAVEIRRLMVKQDRDNSNAINKLALALDRAASASQLLEDFEEMKELLDEVTTLRKKMVESDPTNVHFQRQLWQHYQSLGDYYNLQQKFDEAVKMYGQQKQIVDSLIQVDDPDPEDLTGAAQVAFSIGMVTFQKYVNEATVSGKLTTELKSFQESIDLMNQCLEYFEAIEKIQPLSQSQKDYRKTVSGFVDLIHDTGRKMDEAIKIGRA